MLYRVCRPLKFGKHVSQLRHGATCWLSLAEADSHTQKGEPYCLRAGSGLKAMRRSVKLLVLVPLLVLLATAVYVCLFTYPGRRRESVPSIGSKQITPVSKAEPVTVQAPSRPSGTSSPTVIRTSVTGKLPAGAVSKFGVTL